MFSNVAKEREGIFTLFVFLVSCVCIAAFLRGDVGWSAVCNCAIPDHTHLFLMPTYYDHFNRFATFTIMRPCQGIHRGSYMSAHV